LLLFQCLDIGDHNSAIATLQRTFQPLRRKSARQLDGNGLTARSVGNLELIRAGFPPIIIKPSERTRYLDALAQSDQAGDIHLFLELILDNALQLLADSLAYHISAALQSVCGECRMTRYPEPLSQDNCAELCAGRSVPKSWAFRLWISVPGRAPLEKLAWFGCHSPAMVQHLDLTHGPALYWSSGNSLAFPPWFVDSDHSPFAVELTTATGHGDQWFARHPDQSIRAFSPSDLVRGIAESLPWLRSRIDVKPSGIDVPRSEMRLLADWTPRGPHRSNSGTQKVRLRTQQESLEWGLS
jgi:hypothetical protein